MPTRLHVNYEDLGEREIKGFDRRVRVYAVSQKSDELTSGPRTGAQDTTSDTASVKKPSIAVL